MHSRCVLVFARAPDREAASKRLRGAAPLFERCLDRIASAVAAMRGVDLVRVDEAQQRGGSFGERLAAAFNDARARGYAEIVALPGDVPGITREHLEAAFAALQHEEFVFGPAPDGGVWLLGARTDVARAFAGVPWRTSGVLRKLEENVASFALLAPLADVDDERGLRRLAADRTLDLALRRLIAALVASRVEAAALAVLAPDLVLLRRAHRSRAPPLLPVRCV
jgi:glycosyltransferase A (GT-A) superfamily protein (DUF2064 family)